MVRLPTSFVLARSVLGMLALAVSCESSVDRNLDGLQCDADRACLAGYECRAGLCVRPQPESASSLGVDAAVTSNLLTLDAAALSASSPSSEPAPSDVGLSSQASSPAETGSPFTSGGELTDATRTSSDQAVVETTDVDGTTLGHEDTGVCDGTCTAAPTCDGGACSPKCRAGEERCGDLCVDVTADADNCGRCGQVCVAPSNATTRCVESRCAITCYVGFEACSGGCVDTQTDPLHCGNCGVVCKGNRACIDGVCTK